MANSHGDRNLLLGVLALQFGLVTREQLIAGISAWGTDTSQPLDDVFHRLKFITDDGLNKVRKLLKLHLQMHGGDVEKSLAALSSVAGVRQDLQQIELSALEQSLRHLSPDSAAVIDSQATLIRTTPFSAGQPTRFRILRPHAKGGLGEVSVALDSELNREVALKEIQRQHADEADNRSRFLLEAQITGGLEHPGIVPVYGMGTYADGRPFYAMRFIRGDSLKDGIQKFFDQHSPTTADGAAPKIPARAYESFEFRKLLQRFIDVCNAIAYAHARGVLHRDLKPGNIMLGKYGETLVVDWGLAKATRVGWTSSLTGPDSVETSQPPLAPATDSNSAETVMGSAFGTPAYMSPEQAAGRIDLFSPATDIYSLGATLYHLLTGRPPHIVNKDGQILHRIQQGDYPVPRDLNPNIPAPLAAICQKAMALKPDGRYQTALDFAADVEHWLADDSVTAHQDSLATKLLRWSRRHRTLVTSATALLLTATIALAVSYFLLQAEQTRTLTAKTKAEEAEKRERGEKSKAEEAVKETRQQLATNYFQHGLAEYEAGRVGQALHDLNRALSLTTDDRLSATLRRIIADHALHGGKLAVPYLFHSGEAVAALLSPDGTVVITGTLDASHLWNTHSGEFLGKIMGVSTASFSSDGKLLLTLGTDQTVRLWDPQSCASVGESMRHDGDVSSAIFSPDGKLLLTTGTDQTARLWNSQSGAPVGEPMRHDSNVSSASFSPDGTKVITSAGQAAHVWDVKSRTVVGAPLVHPDKVDWKPTRNNFGFWGIIAG